MKMLRKRRFEHEEVSLAFQRTLVFSLMHRLRCVLKVNILLQAIL